MRKRVILGLMAGATLTVLAAACGGSDDDKNESSTSSQSTPAATVAAAAASVPASTAPAAAAAPTAAPAPAGPQAINVKAGDYFYEPKEFSVRPGAVTVTMSNDGPERPHTFVVRNLNGSGELAKIDRVNVGTTATLEFTLAEEGTYQVLCTLPGHADRGQTATFVVKRA